MTVLLRTLMKMIIITKIEERNLELKILLKQLFIDIQQENFKKIIGTPDSYRSVITKFDVGKATAWRAVKRVVKAICKLRSNFIQWPTEQEAFYTSNRIERKYKFPSVIGAVDGTHIKIPSPKRDSQSYINRKGVHSIQLQVICNDKLEFIHCFAGLPGSVHDMCVFKYSGVQQRCNAEYFPNNMHLLGDSAYTIQKHMMVPYRDNGHLTVEQVYFNKILSSTRMMVERSIGLLKIRWRSLLDKFDMRRTDLIPYYILCCCILHNICLKQEDTFEYPLVIPDNADEELQPLDVDNILKEEGLTKRARLMQFLNENIN
ncbi:putative nuclease HARBI1 isoform X2 [Temnothorax nylanderi]|uniref:putative nuclease HARBI1 isoform X2 n=1 Tax=Temnothorax nylanderi TaxID=102681 RepID=UPI003A85A3B2